MPQSSPATYADWKAPADDGEIVVWPEPEALLAQMRDNHARLSAAEVKVQGTPLRELREKQRQWIGHREPSQLLIASGHQAELYHPGVWAKDAMSSVIARRADGAAYHFAIDTDQPKHLNVRWPGASVPLTDDPSLSTAAWSALLAAPSPKHVQVLQRAVATAREKWSFTPLLDPVLESLRRLALETPNLASAITNATHELDWSLGLRHHAMVTSPIWISEPYLIFLHHVLARAGAFAGDYNAALQDYRRDNGVRSAMRPMPDLAQFGESCEAPFWLDDLEAGTRMRPTVFASGNGWLLELPDGEEFWFDPKADAADAAQRLAKWLLATKRRLAPRALMLTLYIRLFVADQFIHGIGGGRYDQVTDRLIEKQFGIDPPRFSVTTATLFFPEAVGRSRACVPCILQEGHRTRHDALGEQKRRFIERIVAAPRNSDERRTIFYDMHRQLSGALLGSSSFSEWESRLRDSRLDEMQDQQFFDRELFYALQPADRLTRLIDSYKSTFAAV